MFKTVFRSTGIREQQRKKRCLALFGPLFQEGHPKPCIFRPGIKSLRQTLVYFTHIPPYESMSDFWKCTWFLQNLPWTVTTSVDHSEGKKARFARKKHESLRCKPDLSQCSRQRVAPKILAKKICASFFLKLPERRAKAKRSVFVDLIRGQGTGDKINSRSFMRADRTSRQGRATVKLRATAIFNEVTGKA